MPTERVRCLGRRSQSTRGDSRGGRGGALRRAWPTGNSPASRTEALRTTQRAPGRGRATTRAHERRLLRRGSKPSGVSTPELDGVGHRRIEVHEPDRSSSSARVSRQKGGPGRRHGSGSQASDWRTACRRTRSRQKVAGASRPEKAGCALQMTDGSDQDSHGNRQAAEGGLICGPSPLDLARGPKVGAAAPLLLDGLPLLPCSLLEAPERGPGPAGGGSPAAGVRGTGG